MPYVWLLLFFLIPFAIVLKISFAEADIATVIFGFISVISGCFGLLDITLSFLACSELA